jgi:hypothetical protein
VALPKTGELMPFKLGKKDPKWHPRTLMASKYTQDATGAQLPPPEKIYLEYKTDPSNIGMYLNDRLSCCLAAYAGHHLQVITAHTGTIIVPDDDDIEKFYAGFSGYDPSQTDSQGNNPTDNGGYFTDMYAYWQKYGLCGFKIDAWMQIDTKDLAKRMIAIRLFLGCGVGVQLLSEAQNQFSAGQEWSVVPGDESEGGHAILESGEGARGHNFATWGKGDQKATNEWDLACTDEVYVPLTKALISAANDVAPKSLDYDTLIADMKALAA